MPEHEKKKINVGKSGVSLISGLATSLSDKTGISKPIAFLGICLIIILPSLVILRFFHATIKLVAIAIAIILIMMAVGYIVF